MTEELLRNGHLVNVHQLLRDLTIFIQKVNFNKDQKKVGLLETGLQLSKEKII